MYPATSVPPAAAIQPMATSAHSKIEVKCRDADRHLHFWVTNLSSSFSRPGDRSRSRRRTAVEEVKVYESQVEGRLRRGAEDELHVDDFDSVIRKAIMRHLAVYGMSFTVI